MEESIESYEIERLKRRYLLAFGAIFALITVGLIIIQVHLYNVEADSAVVNLSGRQRMLSQRIARYSALYLNNKSSADRSSLVEALASFQRAHRDLKLGNPERGITPPLNEEIAGLYEELNLIERRLVTASQCILEECDEKALALERVELEAENFLELMSKIVFESAAASRQKVTVLKVTVYGLWIALVLLIVLVLFFLLLPFTKRVIETLRQKNSLQTRLEKEILISQNLSRLADLGEVAAGIAHEISNSVGVVSGLAEIIAEEFSVKSKEESDASSPPEALDYLNRIIKQTKKTEKLLDNLKKLSRQPKSLEKKVCNLDEIAKDVTELLAEKSRKERVELRFLNGDKVCAACDETLIYQVLLNLIGNAIDENSHKQGAWIEVSTLGEEGTAKVVVRDSGKGIDPKLAAKMFRPFVTTKEPGKGTGLGLSISSSIASQHGGKLAYSLIDGHTSFILSLPLSPNKKQSTS